MRAVFYDPSRDIGEAVKRCLVIIQIFNTRWLALHGKDCIELRITPRIIVVDWLIDRIKNIDLGIIPCAVAEEIFTENAVPQHPVLRFVPEAVKVLRKETVIKVCDSDA